MKRLLRHPGSVIGACLFVVALLVLHHELQGCHYQDIVADRRSIRPTLLLCALGLTVLAFLLAFLVAQAAGLLSYVPGGLGVFKTAIVLRPLLFALRGGAHAHERSEYTR